MEQSREYYEARRRVNRKKGFYGHLASYLTVNGVFLIVTYMQGEGLGWLNICLFWGIGLASHYLAVFGFPGKQKVLSKEWEDREIQKEMEKMGAYEDQDEAPDTGTPEDELELKEFKKLRKEWDDQDFV